MSKTKMTVAESLVKGQRDGGKIALTLCRGEMVYSQGAGVAAAGKGTEPPANGKQRLDRVTR